jgi:hypothetical protein
MIPQTKNYALVDKARASTPITRIADAGVRNVLDTCLSIDFGEGVVEIAFVPVHDGIRRFAKGGELVDGKQLGMWLRLLL